MRKLRSQHRYIILLLAMSNHLLIALRAFHLLRFLQLSMYYYSCCITSKFLLYDLALFQFWSLNQALSAQTRFRRIVDMNDRVRT